MLIFTFMLISSLMFSPIKNSILISKPIKVYSCNVLYMIKAYKQVRTNITDDKIKIGPNTYYIVAQGTMRPMGPKYYICKVKDQAKESELILVLSEE